MAIMVWSVLVVVVARRRSMESFPVCLFMLPLDNGGKWSGSTRRCSAVSRHRHRHRHRYGSFLAWGGLELRTTCT
ncbi:hypothetical protein QBC37DRAFT_407984 [Rhypophila decipiens]|uniref:Secreted protein n=1 Tax=Rhypophila decipiens TaxID=261697 RepID=A0AAN6YJZ7_9PEZI|nr:hypothetical protein QBC37DRAFT_407984 [Rhypophila decipiens]